MLFFLSGLTCNEDNFITKSGACAHAARLGILLVCPDTSPRKFPHSRKKVELGVLGQVDIPGQEDSWDLGTGAGFYVDATRDPWNKHYKMYSYVTEEMVSIVQSHFHAVRLSGYFDVVGYGKSWDIWPFHGWTWCVNLCLEKSRQVQSSHSFPPIFFFFLLTWLIRWGGV